MNRLETLKTLNILALASLVLAYILKDAWPVWLAAIFIGAGVTDNAFGRGIARRWMKFAEVVGHFNTKLLLGIIFYLILTPIAAVYRLFNKKAVWHFSRDHGGSMFEDVEGDPCSRESFEKPW